MAADRQFVVCDACGFFYGRIEIGETAPTCEICGEERVWAFQRLAAALAHAASINPLFRSRLGSVFPEEPEA